MDPQWLLERFGAQPLLAFCMGVTVLRWVVTALFASHLSIMFAAQMLHAFSFANAAVNAFLATHTASTVAAPTGAGKRASQILPGRETMVTGRSSPSFHAELPGTKA